MAEEAVEDATSPRHGVSEEDPMEREMRSFRDLTNWMNEIFAASNCRDLRFLEGSSRRERVLKIGNVVVDCKDGLVMLCFVDLLAPNTVDWGSVNQRTETGNALSRSECLVNCHYAISMIKQEPFWRSFNRIESLSNDGLDILNGDKALIGVIARNLINFHYLRTLTLMMAKKDVVTDQDILKWTNQQLQTAKMLPRFCR